MKLRNGEELYIFATSKKSSSGLQLQDTDEDIVVTGPSGVTWAAKVWVDIDGDNTIDTGEVFNVDNSNPGTSNVINMTGTGTYNVQVLMATHPGTYTFDDSDNTHDASSISVTAYPAVKIVEEKDDQNNRGEWVFRAALNSDNKAKVVNVAKPSSATWQSTSNDNIQEAVDRYGTFAVKDTTDNQDKYTLYYPDDQVWYDVYIAQKSAKTKYETITVSVGETIPGTNYKVVSVGGTSEEVVPVPPKFTFTDRECMESCSGAKTVVTVGGPCVNEVTKMFSDEGKLPTCSAWASEDKYKGKAVLARFVEGSDEYYVVAGTSAMDTRLAAKVLAYYLEGMTKELPSDVVSAIESEDVVWLDTSAGKVSQVKVTSVQ